MLGVLLTADRSWPGRSRSFEVPLALLLAWPAFSTSLAHLSFNVWSSFPSEMDKADDIRKRQSQCITQDWAASRRPPGP